MKFTYQNYNSAALDADGLANDVAYSGGGFALSAAGPGDGLGHIVTILGNAATNHSGKTFTITGTNPEDQPISQGIAGPNGVATVSSTLYFKTVTSVTVNSTTGADTFDIGWTAAAVGEKVFINNVNDPVINATVFCRVASGTPGYGVQWTGDASDDADDSTSWLAHSTIAAKTATFAGQITFPVFAMRLIFSAAGRVQMTVIEPYNA